MIRRTATRIRALILRVLAALREPPKALEDVVYDVRMQIIRTDEQALWRFTGPDGKEVDDHLMGHLLAVSDLVQHAETMPEPLRVACRKVWREYRELKTRAVAQHTSLIVRGHKTRCAVVKWAHATRTHRPASLDAPACDCDSARGKLSAVG